MSSKAQLTLVGAGPGDPELITLKAVRAISNASVILYDALVNPRLLQYAPAQARMQFVGKRSGVPSMKQEEINDLIVEQAHLYGHVVRLKGGDPFIFGRGFEELAYARSNGVAVHVIPGISSAFALSSLQQVPLTSRGISRSIHVISATDQNGKTSEELREAVNWPGTVVVLMGLRKLGQIARLYTKANRRKTPVMIVQNGTLENEQVVVGDMRTIEKLAEDAGIGTPATIIIGDVVGLKSRTRNVVKPVRYGKFAVGG